MGRVWTPHWLSVSFFPLSNICFCCLKAVPSSLHYQHAPFVMGGMTGDTDGLLAALLIFCLGVPGFGAPPLLPPALLDHLCTAIVSRTLVMINWNKVAAFISSGLEPNEDLVGRFRKLGSSWYSRATIGLNEDKAPTLKKVGCYPFPCSASQFDN